MSEPDPLSQESQVTEAPKRSQRRWLAPAVPIVAGGLILGGLTAYSYLTPRPSSQARSTSGTIGDGTPSTTATASSDFQALVASATPATLASLSQASPVETPRSTADVQASPTVSSVTQPDRVSTYIDVAERTTITSGDNGQDDHPIIASGGPMEVLGPDSTDPAASATASVFANDTLTDISKVPGAQWIDWPAYTPALHRSAVPSLKGTGVFTWPAPGYISTPFSAKHEAIDIAGSVGLPLVAADTGTVVFAAADYGGLGLCLEIDHGNGYVTTYGHLSAFGVTEGQVVTRGQFIGRMGSTGHSTGPHVHFAIKLNGRPVNPLQLLRNSGAGPHPQVTVPSFGNMSVAKATQQAQLYHLALKVDGAVASASQVPGSVAAQEPAAGSTVDTDSTVTVQLAAGPGTPTSPNAGPTVTPVNTPYTIGGDQAVGAPIVVTSTPSASPTPGRGAKVKGIPSPTPTHAPAPTVPLPEP